MWEVLRGTLSFLLLGAAVVSGFLVFVVVLGVIAYATISALRKGGQRITASNLWWQAMRVKTLVLRVLGTLAAGVVLGGIVGGGMWTLFNPKLCADLIMNFFASNDSIPTSTMFPVLEQVQDWQMICIVPAVLLVSSIVYREGGFTLPKLAKKQN